MQTSGIAIVNATNNYKNKEKQMTEVYCPECDELTTQAEINKWEMCHNCEKQMCPECGRVFCGHEDR